MRICGLPSFVASSLLVTMAGCSVAPRSAISLPPEATLATWSPSQRLIDSALANGAPAMALQISDELLSKNPRDVAVLTRRGDALVALNRSNEAAVSYASAIEIEPKAVGALLGLGRVRLQQQPANAEVLFTRVTILDPRNAAALSDLGVARDLQGHHRAAQDAYHMALGITPASMTVQVNLGLSLALTGDTNGALQLLQPLAAAQDATPRVRQDTALALTLDGHRDEASAMLRGDMTAEQLSSTLDGFEALRR